MTTKVLWTLIVSLVLLNCITIVYFMGDGKAAIATSTEVNARQETEEMVAQINGETISRQAWLSELEKRYGKQTLEDMIDEKVIKQMAEKYGIEISGDIIEREMTMIKTMYNPSDHGEIDEDLWREQIETSLLLEELVTKDVVISDEEMKRFYNENKDLYDIPKTYHLSHIVVKSEEEANQVRTELENGSSFAALAMEKSLDEFSANQGGDLGFIPIESDFVPEEYLDIANGLEINEWSTPIQIDDGYAIIMLHEMIDGVTYEFEQVKNQIKRQIAIEQVRGSLSVQPFWEEAGVTWFYGKEN